MKQLYLQAQPAALVDEVVGVGEQFMQNLEGLLQKLMRNRGNILWGLCLILQPLRCRDESRRARF